MSIKTCLVTAAGFGTRMGDHGKNLPKPLWPIFGKTLLDLQLNYVRSLGIENIYINAHHCREQIREWARGKDVNLLEEEEILGSGGCVHNMFQKHTDKKETILIVNSDQFYFFQQSFLDTAFKIMKEEGSCAHLFGIRVDKDEKYNETVVSNDLLVEINKPSGERDYITYSGVGIIDLSQLEYRDGASGFFDSVCNFRNKKVSLTTPDESEYWDYGTQDKYLESMFSVLDQRESEMYKFLEGTNSFEGISKSSNRIEIESIILERKGSVRTLTIK